MKKKIFYAALMLLCMSSYAFGIEEDGEYIAIKEDDSYTIFGNAKKNGINTLDNYIDDLSNSSVSIDKITREDIDKQNNSSIEDIVRYNTGVTVNTNMGSDGNLSRIRMRGTDRVRITIDGLRADKTSGTSPGAEIQFLNTDDLETIEVIKGAQGNVLGTNASGGAINMQTRRGRGPFKFELGSDMGQFGMFKERAAVMGEHHNIDYYLSTTFYKTSGGMRTNDMGRLYNDGYRNFHAVSNIGYRLFDDKAEVRNIFRFSNAKKGIGYGYGDGWMIPNYNDPNNYARNIDIMENLSFKHIVNDYYDYNVRFGVYHNRNNNYLLPDYIYTSMEDITKNNSTRLNVMTQHNVKLASWNNLSVGYNLEKELIDYNSYSDYGYGALAYKIKDSTLQNEVYINDVVNIKDKLFLRGGVRYIHNDAYGDYVTPNGSAALVLPTFKIAGAKTKFRGSWGQSVNNPTLYQRFANVPVWNFFANPNLRSEQLTGWDVGVEQSFWDEKIKFDVGYFNSDYKDYISYVTDYTTWASSYENIDKARIHGYEGKFTFEPNDIIKFVLNYTYVDSQDKSTGLDLPQSPNNTYSAIVYYTPFKERWDLYAGLTTTSSRRASGGSDANNRVKGVVDAKVGTKIRLFSAKGVHVYLKADVMNLFNQNNCMYREGNTFFYSPKIHSRIGIFVEYDTEKQKQIDEQKLVRAQLREEKRIQARQKIENL